MSPAAAFVIRRLLLSSTKRHRAVINSLARRNFSSTSATMANFPLADRYRGTETSIWVEYTGLAAEYKALNLGQGFPDFLAPDWFRKNLAEHAMSDDFLSNQYTRGFGNPKLVSALSEVYSPIMGRTIDPMKEVLVTSGAYQSLFSTFMSLIHPGDEVIIIEPFFDCYEPMTKTAGGVPKFVPLRPPKDAAAMTNANNWTLDADELRAAFSAKTKAVVLNTPNNPLGKVFSRAELEQLAALCVEKNVLCIADEVYEWMCYDREATPHVKIATLPGMWERTVTIGSAGKTFSMTGWKLGWAIAPASLMSSLHVSHQNCVYTCNTPTQLAVADGFRHELTRRGTPECYLTSLADELLPKRDQMAAVLKKAGFQPVIPMGGYFMVAGVDNLPLKVSGDDGKPLDTKLVKWLTREHRLATIPMSCFYSDSHKSVGEKFVRFCFIKSDETISKAGEILAGIKSWNIE